VQVVLKDGRERSDTDTGTEEDGEDISKGKASDAHDGERAIAGVRCVEMRSRLYTQTGRMCRHPSTSDRY